MAGANQQITSVSIDSDKEEEDKLHEGYPDEVRTEEEEGEDEEEEDEDEEEDEEEEDTCVYDKYKFIEYVEVDIFSKDDPEEYRIYLRYAIKTEEDEDEDEDEDEHKEKDEEKEDTCVYDEYKVIEDVNDDIFSKDDPEEYLRYAIKTEGFYLPFAPKDALGVVTPVGPCSSWWPKVAEGAELAVAHYNKNRAGPDGQLKLVSIRLANLRSVGGVLFYITFEAEHVASGDVIDYQTKLFWGHDGSWEVLLIRKDPEVAAEMIQLDMPRLEAIIQNRNAN